MESITNIWPSYRRRAAENISYHVARWRRGYLDRRKVKLILWNRVNHAATLIQRRYRFWRDSLRFFLLSAQRRRIKTFHPSNIRRMDPKRAFERVLSGEGTLDEKLVIWRLAVDLRRAHSSQSTDNCIKAILESQGEIHRATTLLGLPVFTVRHFDHIPEYLKNLFLPCVSQEAEAKFDQEIAKNLFQSPSQQTIIRAVGIQAIRQLKNKVNQKNLNFKRKSELADALAIAVEKSYFSNRHVGSKYIPVKQRKVYAPLSKEMQTNDPQ